MKTIQLSPAQLTLLESFANMKSQEEADELSRVTHANWMKNWRCYGTMAP